MAHTHTQNFRSFLFGLLTAIRQQKPVQINEMIGSCMIGSVDGLMSMDDMGKNECKKRKK